MNIIHSMPRTRLPLPLLAALLLASLAPSAAEARQARCVIRQNGAVAYSGRCQFTPDKGGSFSIRSSLTRPILPSITDVSVAVISPGNAEVRGLTTNGNNSRWGPAVRSKRDSACWTGADFEVCAY